LVWATKTPLPVAVIARPFFPHSMGRDFTPPQFALRTPEPEPLGRDGVRGCAGFASEHHDKEYDIRRIVTDGLTSIEHSRIQCIGANSWSACRRGMTNNLITNRFKPVRSVVSAGVQRVTRVVQSIGIGLVATQRNLLGLVGVDWWGPSGWRLSPTQSPEYDIRRIGLAPALTYSFAVIPREMRPCQALKRLSNLAANNF
jgi:hypothetical protein